MHSSLHIDYPSLTFNRFDVIFLSIFFFYIIWVFISVQFNVKSSLLRIVSLLCVNKLSAVFFLLYIRFI